MAKNDEKPKKLTPKITRGATPTPPPSHEDEEELDEEEDVEEGDEEETPTKLKSKNSASESEDEDEEEVDYLKKYQYKKVNGVPVLGSVGGDATNPDKGSKAAVMKKALLTQPKVEILIPLAEGSDPKVLHSVTLNGYRLDFPTNTYVKVPKQVAEIIRQSNNQTVQALAQFQGKVKDDALN